MTARILVSFIIMAVVMLAIAIAFPVGTRLDYWLLPIALVVFLGSFWMLSGLSK